LIVLYIGYPIPSPESVVGDDDYDTHSTKKCRLSGKILEGALHVMKDNTKAIVIAMNEGEAPRPCPNFQKKGEKMQIQGEQHRISATHFLAVEILLHIHVEDFITYPWTPRTHFLDFI
jgi:hypothetical protein